MTSEIDCTTRTKQKSTLSVDTLYRTRVRMLGPTLVPSVNSIVRTVIATRKLQSLAATAAACEVHWETQYGPLAHVRGDSSWPCFRNIGSTREYLGSNNSMARRLCQKYQRHNTNNLGPRQRGHGGTWFMCIVSSQSRRNRTKLCSYASV